MFGQNTKHVRLAHGRERKSDGTVTKGLQGTHHAPAHHPIESNELIHGTGQGVPHALIVVKRLELA